MSVRPVIDAGPALNVFSINRERVLIGVLGPLSAPETVQEEVLHRAKREGRFRAAANVWRKLGEKYMQVLSDGHPDESAEAVSEITWMPMAERIQDRSSLGEVMVIAHAVIAVKAGQNVTVLIDDGGGRNLAAAQSRRFGRLREQGNNSVGQLNLISTVTVLRWAATKGLVLNMADMRDMHARLRGLDDGLLPIEETGLLEKSLWKSDQ